jgi:hypothetical protein
MWTYAYVFKYTCTEIYKVITNQCIRVIVSQVFLFSYLQVVIIDTIVMETGDDKSVPTVPHSCAAHDYDLMKPVVLATWKHGFQGACPDKSAILAESQVKHFACFIPYLITLLPAKCEIFLLYLV